MISCKNITVFMLMTVLVFGGVSMAKVIYVDASAAGTNDGTTWADAFVQLRSILDPSDPCYPSDPCKRPEAGDQIWVAAGVYKPTSGSDTSISFELVDGVAMLPTEY